MLLLPSPAVAEEGLSDGIAAESEEGESDDVEGMSELALLSMVGVVAAMKSLSFCIASSARSCAHATSSRSLLSSTS